MHKLLKDIPYQDRDGFLGIESPEPNFLCPLIATIIEDFSFFKTIAKHGYGTILEKEEAMRRYNSALCSLEQLREEAEKFRAWGLALRDKIAESSLTNSPDISNILSDSRAEGND